MAARPPGVQRTISVDILAKVENAVSIDIFSYTLRFDLLLPFVGRVYEPEALAILRRCDRNVDLLSGNRVTGEISDHDAILFGVNRRRQFEYRIAGSDIKTDSGTRAGVSRVEGDQLLA